MTIEIALIGDSSADRIAALDELLRVLNADETINADGVYERGTVVVKVGQGLGGKQRWAVPLHLVWPKPELNNGHLNTVKLMNFTAIYAIDWVTAKQVRRFATESLRDSIRDATAQGRPLNDRLKLVNKL